MEVYLKKTDYHDVDILLMWRNDDNTRNNFFNSEIVQYDEHRKWFDKKMKDEACFMYMLMDGEDRLGHIRIDIKDDVGEISYTISPDKRNMGYGKTILTLVEKEEIIGKVKALIGIVQSSNKSSQKCFVNNGYIEFNAGDVVCYIKILK